MTEYIVILNYKEMSISSLLKNHNPIFYIFLTHCFMKNALVISLSQIECVPFLGEAFCPRSKLTLFLYGLQFGDVYRLFLAEKVRCAPARCSFQSVNARRKLRGTTPVVTLLDVPPINFQAATSQVCPVSTVQSTLSISTTGFQRTLFLIPRFYFFSDLYSFQYPYPVCLNFYGD